MSKVCFMFAWIGILLLSLSWLWGLGYYHLVNWPAWVAVVAAGTICLAALRVRLPSIGSLVAVSALTLPACFITPLPYRAGMILLTIGSAAAAIACIVARSIRSRESLESQTTRATSICHAAIGAMIRMSAAMMASASVLIAQGLGLEAYMAKTARSHELPGPLAQAIGLASKALGIDSAVHGSNLAAFSMRKIHNLGATWELLLDPATFCFILGAAVFLGWRLRSDQQAKAVNMRSIAGMAALLVVLIVIWMPLRAAVLVAWYLHEVLRVDYDAPLEAMRRFWSAWTHGIFLVPAALLAWRLVPLRPCGSLESQSAGPLGDAEKPLRDAGPATRTASGLRGCFSTSRRRAEAVVLAFAAAGALTAAVVWEPIGSRKPGRVVIEEYHPEGDKQWERTDKPFDTTWYGHMSGYNYYCIYDYMTRFYDVVRRSEPLNDAALENCDVLIVKVPTRPYANQEIEAIERFVDRGGGLMLVGEHTNVFHSGIYLNSIARRFGFLFRYDCLFGVDQVFEQRYRPPAVPHPIVQHVPWMDFATSCSIAPGESRGRAAMRSVGLKSLMADYHVSNFYPRPDDSPEMRYGAFVQLWTMRFGRGRIAAFTDSTIFSNFCVFEPGKKELWIGMVEWLNHQAPDHDLRRALSIVGFVLAVIALAQARRLPGGGLVLLAAGTLGWTAVAVGWSAYATRAMPPPKPLRPYVQVNLDQTVSPVRLPRNGFISIDSTDYGIFERWILRLGYFTARRNYPDVCDGDLIVFLEPSRPVSPEYRAALVRFVDSGGKLLVVDAPLRARRPIAPPRRTALNAGNQAVLDADDDGARDLEGRSVSAKTDDCRAASDRYDSTTNELIEPFGMSVDHSTVVGDAQTRLVSAEGWPAVPSHAAVVVRGGRPFAWVGDQPVGASISIGNRGGSVTVVGFGARFREEQMGGSGDIEPDKSADKTLRDVYEWEYALLRAIVKGQPLGQKDRPPRAAAGP